MAPRNKENNGGGQKKGGRGRRRSEERGSGNNNGGEIGGEDYRRRRDRNNQVNTQSLLTDTLQVLMISYSLDSAHLGILLDPSYSLIHLTIS